MRLLLLVFCFPLLISAINTDSLLHTRFVSPAQSSLFLFTAGYKLPHNKNNIINSGHGIYLEAGINSARLFSKNSIIGVYGGWVMMDRLWSTSFSEDFRNDYQSSLNADAFSGSVDSAIAYTFGTLMNTKKGRSLTLPGCEMNSFHNYSLYYGIALKLPFRYSPVLKLYTGSMHTHLQGAGNLLGGKNDYTMFQLRRKMYGAELILFRGWQNTSNAQRKVPAHKNRGALSFYYEYYDLANASLFFDDGETQKTVSLQKTLRPLS